VIPLVADDAGLRSFAQAVSTPGSDLYGHYESVPQLAARFGARPALRAAAVRFLTRSGATVATVNPTGLFAEAKMTVRAAENTFGTDLRSYGGSAGTPRFIAPAPSARVSAVGDVTLPAGLSGVATGIVGLNTRSLARGDAVERTHARIGRASDYKALSGTPSGCSDALASGAFTPNQYDTAYGISALHHAGLSGQGQRLAMIEIDDFRTSDIKTFASCFGLTVPRLTTYIADKRPALGGESTLDVEIADAVAPKLAGIDVYETSGDASDVAHQLVAPLLQPGVKPAVVSVSLGKCEPNFVKAFGHSALVAAERDVDFAAANGVTLVAATGDFGSSECRDDKGNPTPSLSVYYPASSPFVTAVGGTNITLDANNLITSQQVWNDGADIPGSFGGGGGGVSTLFKAPSYQNGVASQLQLEGVSVSSRVVPDVALLADQSPGYAIFCKPAGNSDCEGSPRWNPTGGTSAATPLFAAAATLIDQDLDRANRADLGFVNPLLYSIGTGVSASPAYFDVVSGDDDLGPYIPGHNAALGCCTAGTGFDAATGWGGVNFNALDALARQQLPAFGRLSVSIPQGQHPVRNGSLTLKLGCSQKCTIYGLGVIFSSSRFNVTTSKLTLSGRGTVSAVVRFSHSQLKSLSSAIAHHLAPDGDFYAVGVTSDGSVARTTSAVDYLLRR
jgi:kumamolisin